MSSSCWRRSVSTGSFLSVTRPEGSSPSCLPLPGRSGSGLGAGGHAYADPADPPLDVPRRSRPGETHDWRAASEIQRWRNSPPSDWWQLSEQISCPTLIVGGTNSHIRQDRLAELARRIPNARYESMDGGHDLHARRPGEFDTLIRTVLNALANS